MRDMLVSGECMDGIWDQVFTLIDISCVAQNFGDNPGANCRVSDEYRKIFKETDPYWFSRPREE